MYPTLLGEFWTQALDAISFIFLAMFEMFVRYSYYYVFLLLRTTITTYYYYCVLIRKLACRGGWQKNSSQVYSYIP